MGASQFGHPTIVGALTLSWLARRMSRLLLVFRRLGTATGLLLVLLLLLPQPVFELCQWCEPWVQRRFGFG